jgi:hypothetical protein
VDVLKLLVLARHQTERQEFRRARRPWGTVEDRPCEVQQHRNAHLAWCLTVSRSRVDNAVDNGLPRNLDGERGVLLREGRRLAGNQPGTCLLATRTPDQRCSVAVLIMATPDSRGN